MHYVAKKKYDAPSALMPSALAFCVHGSSPHFPSAFYSEDVETQFTDDEDYFYCDNLAFVNFLC